jgi:hypothetical protein
MACIRISVKRNVNSLIRKISYWGMPTGIKIMGVPKKPLFIVHWRKEKDQILTKGGPTIGKRGGLQD